MAIRVAQFDIGKDADTTRINRFFKELSLKASNILSAEVVEQGRDTAKYVVTYEDVTKPFLVLTLPADGDTNVAPGTPIIAIFSEAIKNVTVSDIEIYDVTNAAIIATSLYTIDNTGASNSRGEIRIVDSGNYIVAGRVYRITFKTSITDLSGNALDQQEAILLGSSVTPASLDFDGGRISSFTQDGNRYEATVTPTRLTFGSTSVLHLEMGAAEKIDLEGFSTHYERLSSPANSFKAVIDSTGLLIPTAAFLDWEALNGLV